MRVGGPADEVITAETSDDLVRHASRLWAEDEPWMLLGGGSNTVVSDDGFPGTVLLVRNTGIEVVESDATPAGRVRLRVQAGHDWDQLVEACVERGWSGIEALSGVPGRAGAAPVQNIGAYGQELSDVLHSITFLDFASDEVRRIPAAELALGYRTSAIKEGLAGVVLSIDLLLWANEDRNNPMSGPVAYGQLADALGVTVGDRVSIRELRRTVLRLRASKGMVLDADDHDTWSSGSFFTNPIVTEHFARSLPLDAPKFPVPGAEPAPAVTSLEDLAAGAPLRIPDAAPERMIKLSAAWLIERSGISRGYRLPGSGAAVSSKHTLAITNRGASSAADVAELARFIVQRVQQEFGVVLAPEPNLYGLEA
ncbi:UDP-N-acetylmuramate dehydrogenase [Leucobacter tardus]|uniref:UDP-N-acetylenolpyruvoylglucosamine reductase n=1 Tax=Leucobacter tardus TaxID=501483 RepID=A0A939QGI4_9MICO|nr:UDP-N-acetylmuramate dehydrogenase [Leucobacter tardus]MBO2990813.1 UDP-N-acetylmuramate dehydrogenase [Leucobacter tardus]